MKKIYKNIFMLALAGTLCSCNDYLDKEPLSDITPEAFFTDDSQLAAYVNNYYASILPSHGNWSYGLFGSDSQTDNQTSMVYDDKYVKGKWKVDHEESSNWVFTYINNINYLLEQVTPKFEDGTYTSAAAKHYLGEAYFLRAYEYFKRYQMFGDFPIITEPLADDLTILQEASARAPRNEVARFILSDLDKAITYLGATDMATTRINKDAALLLKSRVALFEGTWLKYFAGTAFVPGTGEWPGSSKNSSFSYQAGSVENEAKWFLEQAMDAAKQVADKMLGNLAINTGIVPQKECASMDAVLKANPYMAVFSAENMSSYPEVLMWRQYNKGLGIQHCVVMSTHHGNYGVGVTRGMVEGFLMKNGLPIYAEGSGYQGDATIKAVRADRDPRLNVFLKEKGQYNLLFPHAEATHSVEIEPAPALFATDNSDRYVTGYALRKGWSPDGIQCGNGNNYTGCVVFHGVEALLNYMEASYEVTGTLNATAQQYWRAIRERQGMDADFQKTIAATDISKEAAGDWGAYSGGKMLTDATLYNIRRERRCEMMAEGLRWMDLCRWRAMDQMITTPYHIEGIHLWGTPLEAEYTATQLNAASPKERSEYFRPYETDPTSEVYNGYVWTMAHYLRPIPAKQFQLTSTDSSDFSTTTMYQNPYWPTVGNEPATK